VLIRGIRGVRLRRPSRVAGAAGRPPRAVEAGATLAALVAGALGLAPSAGAQSAEPGFGFDAISIAPAGAFVGGFDLLPNGNYAVFDGTSVVELAESDGSLVQTIWTPASSVFGSFVTRSPDGSKLYFGESTEGKVYEIDVATKSAQPVIDTVFPYDLAFDPSGRAFLAYATTFSGGGSFVALCDFTAGTLDDVIDSPDSSGPVAFDRDGNLFFATPDTSSFPPPPDSTEVLRFAKADVDSAIGSGVLGVDQGTLVASLDGASAFALDEAGDVLVSDPNTSQIVDVDGATSREDSLVQGRPFTYFNWLRHVGGRRGAFERFQPSEAGVLLAAYTDFFSFNQLVRIRPARPQLSTRPASPIPPGLFDFDVTGAVPDGFGFMFLADGVLNDEFAVRNRTWPAPLFFGLDFSGGVRIVPLATDSLGEFHEQVDNPGLGGVSVAFQLVVGSAARGPLFGTSEALEIVLQ
jgi:hypothetical protein